MKISHFALILSLICLITGSSLGVQAAGPRITIRAVTKGESNTSFAIISSRGTVILVDPYQVEGEFKPDLIAVTHLDDEHYDKPFVDRCDCRKSIAALESFTLKDVEVVSIPASHKDNNINKQEPSDIIYLFALDGIRVACMGDIGQDSLTAEQLAILGRTDIVILPCASLPDEGLTIEKSVSIVRQLNPGIVIPTHVSMGGQILAALRMGLSYQRIGAGELTVGAAELREGERRLVYLREYVPTQ